MKRFGSLVGLALAGAMMMSTAVVAADTVKFGIFAPLTGPSAQAGQAMRNGAAVAVAEINEKGGLNGAQVELLEYDDRSSPEQAVRSVTKMVQVDNVNGIIGSLHSGNILAAGPTVEAAKIPLVGTGTSPTWLAQGFTYMFRSLSNSDQAVGQLANYAKDKGLNKLAIFHSNDEYGNAGSSQFKTAAEANGLQIANMQSFTHGDRDFTGQLGQMISSGPDALFVWALGDDLGPVTKQIRQWGFQGPILGPEGFTLPQVIEIAGSSANGVVFASQYLVPKSVDGAAGDLMRAFVEKYEATYGGMPESDTAFRAYDAAMILAEGVRRAGGTDGEKMRDAIANLSDFEGIAGTFNFVGGNGEGIQSVRYYQITDGSYSVLE